MRLAQDTRERSQRLCGIPHEAGRLRLLQPGSVWAARRAVT
jgi:hypothetical protein